MIVKIQLPIKPDPAGQHMVVDWSDRCLVYNEDRSFECFLKVTEELVEAMGGTVRAFFEVYTGPVGAPEDLQILALVEEQGW